MHLPNATLFIAFWSFYEYNNEAFGAVAHLGERVVRNDEVASSILVSSTIESKMWQDKNIRPLHVE